MAPPLLLLGLLLACGGGAQALVPPSELKRLSAAGSKYVEAEVENAVGGVGRMKALLERSSKEHQALLHSLQETKRRKEEAVQLAQEKEKELAARQGVCNETMLALWEQCKPCLKHTCMRFYSRTCHSGSGLVGRQLEEFLNRSSPFSVWVNGERVDALLERGERQERRLEELEEGFGMLEDGVDDLFQDATRVYGRRAPFFAAPFGGFREAFLPPPAVRRVRGQRLARELSPFGWHHPARGFHHLFQPLLELTQRLLDGGAGSWEHPLLGFGPEFRNFTNDRMVCREIRRNSAGCLRLRDECEKCREILAVDCSQGDPEAGELREEFEDAVRLAERFGRRYEQLLGAFQAELLNASSLAQQLERDFGWVSRLANLSRGSDGFLQVTTVLSKVPDPSDPSAPPATQVTVQLFDGEPLALRVPGDIPWDDPRFMQSVAEQALRHYKENAVE